MFFLIKKPKNTSESPKWVPAMDKYDGKVVDLEMKDPTDKKYYAESEDGYVFNKSWLTPIDDIKPKNDADVDLLTQLI